MINSDGIPDLSLLPPLSLARQLRNQSATPQNTVTIPVGDLKGNLEALLKSSDCKQYTNLLLAEAAKRYANPFNLKHINSIMEGYDKIHSQGGYVLRQTSYDTVEGDLFNAGMNVNAGPGTVLLVPNRQYRNPTAKELAFFQSDYAWTALHETLHLGKRGHYSDEQLAIAAFSLAGKAAPTSGLAGYARATHFSDLLDGELKLHCPKPKQ